MEDMFRDKNGMRFTFLKCLGNQILQRSLGLPKKHPEIVLCYQTFINLLIPMRWIIIIRAQIGKDFVREEHIVTEILTS